MEERVTSRRAPIGALLLCLIGLLVSLAAAAPHPQALLIVAVGFWFTLPGVLFARRAYATQALLPAAMGAVWGYAASVLVLLALWVAGLRNAVALVGLSPVLAGLALLPLGRRAMLAAPVPDRRDVRVLALLLLVVPLVVARPWSRVGELTPEGRTYRAYFTADFIWRMAVTAEVAKGDVPPHNQFFRGDDLRYYWAADLLPAVEYRAMGRTLRLEDVLLANALVVDVIFVAFLYAFTRHWTSSAGAAGVAAAAAILLGSFEGTERILALAYKGVDLGLLRMYNIDAISRWEYGNLPIDDLHRTLFWKPQHAMGYALGYSALLVTSASPGTPTPRVMALAGVALAAALFFSSFSAIMLTCIVALVAAARYVAARRWGAMIAGAAVAAVPLAAAVATTLALRYVDRGESLVRLLINPNALSHPWIAIPLSFGAMLPAAIAGSVLAAVGGATRRVAPLWAAVAVCFFFFFFVDVRDHQYVYVGWRAGDLLFIAFGALAGFALESLWRRGAIARRATVVAGVLLAAIAVPTLAIDLYNTQDTSNREQGPGFRWTVVLPRNELAALEWIKRYTPPDAIVQVEPQVRGRDTWAYIPAFAERRMAAGLPISMVPLDKYVAASARVQDLYRTTDARTAYRLARELGVEYLVVGPPERHGYPEIEWTLGTHPQYFRPVFRNGSMTIYLIERGESGPRARSRVLP